MDRPSVSIIIPAKNEENNIRYCLGALRALDFPGKAFEVIVVDNGSSDATVSIVEEYGYAAHIEPHLSLSGLRNFGARVASGEILAFLDADCVPEKDWLKNALDALSVTEVGCTGSTPVAPANGGWVERVWSSFRTRRRNRCYTSWINSSNLLVKSDLFAKVGGFNESVETCEDVDICMRLNKICRILFDPSIKVMHLGEPKTIKAFFLKEIWRGKGTVSGIVSHGISMSELKSIALPLYYLGVTMCGLFGSIFYGISMLLVTALLYSTPAAIFTAWIISRTGRTNYILGYFILFLIYANARVVALFVR